METWSVVGKPEKSFRFVVHNEQLLYKEETITSYLMPLFSPSSPQLPGESLQHCFSEGKKGGKCNQEKNVLSFSRALVSLTRTIQRPYFTSYLYCNVKMLPVYGAIIINPPS